MFYVKDSNGRQVNILYAAVYTTCLLCGEEFEFKEFHVLAGQDSIEPTTRVFCTKCSKVLKEGELKKYAKRFSGSLVIADLTML